MAHFKFFPIPYLARKDKRRRRRNVWKAVRAIKEVVREIGGRDTGSWKPGSSTEEEDVDPQHCVRQQLTSRRMMGAVSSMWSRSCFTDSCDTSGNALRTIDLVATIPISPDQGNARRLDVTDEATSRDDCCFVLNTIPITSSYDHTAPTRWYSHNWLVGGQEVQLGRKCRQTALVSTTLS